MLSRQSLRCGASSSALADRRRRLSPCPRWVMRHATPVSAVPAGLMHRCSPPQRGLAVSGRPGCLPYLSRSRRVRFTDPFTGTGAGLRVPLRHTNFRRRVWLDALGAAKLPAIHFHDLRHTGNTLAANAGASLRELMERMGHESERAALVYLHSSEERQHQIADTLSKLAAEELKRGSKRQGGESTTRRSDTQRARLALAPIRMSRRRLPSAAWRCQCPVRSCTTPSEPPTPSRGAPSRASLRRSGVRSAMPGPY
jgi:integrase